MLNKLNSKNFILILTFVIVLPIWFNSVSSIYENRNKIQGKVLSLINSNDEVVDEESVDETGSCYYEKSCVDEHSYWAEEIMKGGYILHFRHAERDKWIDVHMYDALESDVHNKGLNQSRLAENDYFKEAVCLNARGEIQAKAMGEHLENINFPTGYIISSPICRSRQTAEIVFGYYDTLDRTLVHRGAYKEDPNEHIRNLRNLFLNLPVENGKNTIVSSHNSVIHIDMFDESVLKDDQFELEEGGFYVISNNNGVLKLEHSFYYFRDFIINFYPRG